MKHFFLTFLILLGLWQTPLSAQTPTASVTLNPNPATVGETVELLVTVEGATEAGEPPAIEIEGAHVEFATATRRFEQHNLEVKMQVVYLYQVIPQRVGTLKVPPLRLRAEGKSIRTRATELKVVANQTRTEAAADAFVEWVVPKSTVFLSEVLPLEVRVYLVNDAGLTWRAVEPEPFAIDGCIVQKWRQKERATRVQRDGRSYTVITFQSTLSASKTGQISLPAMDVHVVGDRVEGRRRQGRRTFDDIFGDDDPFESLFGQVRREQRRVQPAPVNLEVKPLPTVGRPNSFSGAVGQFSLKTRATPGRVKLGEPVTLTVEVTGAGSFRQMKAPLMPDAKGWRTYPPTEQFEEGDELGISGTKRFEMAVIPETGQTELPEVVFSYFDPVQEKYVTLKGEPIPVVVDGAPAAPAPSATPAVAAGATPAPAATATPVKEGDALLYIRHDRGSFSSRAFQPEWQRPLFWIVQAVSLVAYFCWVGLVWRQRRWADGSARRLATLRREAAAARAEMAGNDPERFWAGAVAALQIEAATRLAREGIEREPATVDESYLCQGLDPELAEELRQIFAEHDALHYAGGGGRGPVGDDRRRRVEAAIHSFANSSWAGS